MQVAKAAIDAVLTSELVARCAYVDLMLSKLPGAEQRAVEEWMSQSYEYQSRLFRRLVAEGRAEGRAEAVLNVLVARGFEVPEPVADRVRPYRDFDQLKVWLKQAMEIDSIDELAD